MINNDCLRRLRYILDFDDSKMIAVFAQGGQKVTQAQLSCWLKKEDADKLARLLVQGTQAKGPGPGPKRRIPALAPQRAQ